MFCVSPSSHVFEHGGLDYFGPLLIKHVFTCMASSALYTEIACFLDTFSFLNAFRRFACPWGFPSHVYSDSGGNFIAAELKMREGVNMLRELHDTLLPLGINWHF